MKILITGSNGLLGQKLVQLLIEEDVDMIATSRGESRLAYLNKPLVYESFDITNESEVNEIMIKHQPDVVINTAAMTDVDKCESEQEACRMLNVESVRYLVAACQQTGSFFLHLSTDFIFDGENGPYAEDAAPNPISFYGQSKLDAENIIQENNIASGHSWSNAVNKHGSCDGPINITFLNNIFSI